MPRDAMPRAEACVPARGRTWTGRRAARRGGAASARWIRVGIGAKDARAAKKMTSARGEGVIGGVVIRRETGPYLRRTCIRKTRRRRGRGVYRPERQPASTGVGGEETSCQSRVTHVENVLNRVATSRRVDAPARCESGETRCRRRAGRLIRPAIPRRGRSSWRPRRARPFARESDARRREHNKMTWHVRELQHYQYSTRSWREPRFPEELERPHNLQMNLIREWGAVLNVLNRVLEQPRLSPSAPHQCEMRAPAPPPRRRRPTLMRSVSSTSTRYRRRALSRP